MSNRETKQRGIDFSIQHFSVSVLSFLSGFQKVDIPGISWLPKLQHLAET